MMTIHKVCKCILTGLLCILFTVGPLNANIINTIPTVGLFENIHTGADKKGLIEEAVFFSINKNALKKIRRQKLETMQLQIPFGTAKKLEVNLKKVGFLSTDFRMILQKRDLSNTLSYSPGLYYRGAISGVKDALVTISFFDDLVIGVLSLNGENYNLGPYQNINSDLFVLYKERDLNASNPFSCSTVEPENMVFRQMATARGRSQNKVRVYVECDHFLYEANDFDLQKTVDYTTGLFNIIAAVYAQDDIEIELSEVKVWETEAPYPTSSAREARDAFGQRLNGQFNGDIAHLLSNYHLNGAVPNGGSANIDVLCKKEKAVGYSNITNSYNNYPVYSWTTYAVAHEIGHNLAAPHTHSCLWPAGPIDNCWCPEGDCDPGPEPESDGGTLMSYCHLNPKWANDCDLSAANPGINLAKGLGPLPGALIRDRIANAQCLNEKEDIVVSVFQASAEVVNPSCNLENGAISLVLSFGQSPYSYKWSNGAITKNIEGLPAGVYTCIVTDAAGKTTAVEATLNPAEEFTVNAGPNRQLNCDNPEIVLEGSYSGSGSFYFHSWSDHNGSVTGNSRTDQLMISQPGSYIFTVQDTDSNCIVSDTVIVTEDFSEPLIFIHQEPLNCRQSSTRLEVQSSSGDLTYLWTGPNGFQSEIPDPEVAEEGWYQIVATAPNGCTTEKIVEVERQVTNPEFSVKGGTINCERSAITFQVNTENPHLSYHWTGPEGFVSTEKIPTTTIPGIYQVSAVSREGCEAQRETLVDLDQELPILVIQGAHLDCRNDRIHLKALSNDSLFFFEWRKAGVLFSTEKEIDVVSEGYYFVSAVGLNGCIAEDSFLVLDKRQHLDFNLKVKELSCFQPGVQIAVAHSAGQYFYSWTGPEGYSSQASDPVVRIPGTYTLQLVDEGGCSQTKSITVSEIPSSEIIIRPPDILSCRKKSVYIDASQSMLTEGAVVEWATIDGIIASQIEELIIEVSAAGVYGLTIRDTITGCVAIERVVINSTPDISARLKSTYGLPCTGEPLKLSPEEGQFPSTTIFSWATNGGHIVNDHRQAVIEVDAPGLYILFVIDTLSGCTDATFTRVREVVPLEAILKTPEILTCSQPTIFLNGTGSFLSSSSLIEWYKEGQLLSEKGLFLPVSSGGFYTLLIRDTLSHCISEFKTEVIRHAAPEVFIKELIPDVCGYGEGAISLSVDSVNPYRIEWNNGATGSSISGLSGGDYTVTVTDQSGCQTVLNQKIEASLPITLGNVDIEPVSCHGEKDGRIKVNIKGGTGFLETFWTNGAKVLDLHDLPAGLHSLEVEDALGCQESFDFEIREPSPLEVEVQILENDVLLQVSGGVPDYQYRWDNGQTEPYASNLASGKYSVLVEDVHRCSITKTFVIHQNNVINQTADLFPVVRVYPNPASDYFQISGGLNTNGPVVLKVFNSNGVEVLSEKGDSKVFEKKINTREWQPGSYYLLIHSGQEQYFQKIQIVRQ